MQGAEQVNVRRKSQKLWEKDFFKYRYLKNRFKYSKTVLKYFYCLVFHIWIRNTRILQWMDKKVLRPTVSLLGL